MYKGKTGGEFYLSLQQKQSLLFVAIEGGHTETAQLLIDKGAVVNKCDEVCTMNKCSDTYTLFLF